MRGPPFEKAKVGDVASVNYGYTESASSEVVGPKFLRITDIQDGKVDWEAVPYCEIDERNFAKHKLEAGDIVFARTGATTGKSFLIQSPPESVPASYLIRLRVTDKRLAPDYLALFFQTSRYWEVIEQGSSGSAQGGFNASKLKDLEIPLPPLEEQKRIVAVLDQAFAALDRARANAEANLADAEELFDSWLTAVFHEHPASWKTAKLKQLCHQITVGHVGPMANRYASNGTPFLRSQNVRPFRIDLDEVKFIDDKFRSELKKSELKPGDVAIVRTGYPGTAAVIPDDLPLANCADLVIARPKPELEAEFLAMFLNSSFGKKMVAEKSVGAAQKHFNVGAAKEVDFAYPAAPEQKAIIEKAKSARKLTGRAAATFDQKIGDIDELRQSILQKAFAGELT